MQWVKEKQVTEITTLSRASVDRMVKAGTFPKPIYLSARRKVWQIEVIHEWMNSRLTLLAEPSSIR